MSHRTRRCPSCHRRRYVATDQHTPKKRWREVDGVMICYVCADKPVNPEPADN